MDLSDSSTAQAARTASLCVIIPVCNEAAVLPLLMPRLCAALEPIPAHVNVLFVDDGSVDATPQELARTVGARLGSGQQWTPGEVVADVVRQLRRGAVASIAAGTTTTLLWEIFYTGPVKSVIPAILLSVSALVLVSLLTRPDEPQKIEPFFSKGAPGS